MSEWRDVLLDQVIDFGIGGTPSRNTPSFWSEKPLGHPWLSISDLNGKFISQTAEHISDIGASCSNVKLIPANTTVMSFKLSIGKTAITLRPMFCNEAIAFFEPKYNQADSRWLYHELPRASKHVATDIAVKGATLNKQKIRLIPFRLPPLEEQKKIAEILDTLDTQIYQTEALITKLEQIKQGLLTDLLSRGIAANGQLRPIPAQAPQLYKDSPLGLIPKAWTTGPMESLLERIIDYRGKTPTKTSHGIPLITAKNVRMGYIDPEPREFISETDYPFWMTRGFPISTDVVFTTEAPLGNVAQIGTSEKVAFAQRVIILQPLSSVSPDFLRHLLMTNSFQSSALALSSGSTALGIKQSTFRKIMVAHPIQKEEQQAIAERLGALEKYKSTEANRLGKLREQKSGLMDDLLTGRVRVTPLLALATTENA